METLKAGASANHAYHGLGSLLHKQRISRLHCLEYNHNPWCHFREGLTESGGDHFLDSLAGCSLMGRLVDFASQSLDFWVNTAIWEEDRG